MKIGIIGSINMDMVVQTDRIPLKGETLEGNDLKYIPGGKGANQAVAAARLQGDVTMFGCVGNDSAGDELKDNLKKQGVKTEWIKTVDNIPTGIALITIGEKDNAIVVVAGANKYVTIDYIESVKTEILKCDIILIQHEIPQESNEYVVKLCYDAGKKIILNPAPARPIKESIIEKLTYLTPNEHEAKIIFGVECTMDEVVQLCPNKLIITQGAQGVMSCLPNGTIIRIPARKSNVVDTTGAGDTLNGAFAVAISEGKTMFEALNFANVSASLSTEKYGAQTGMPSKKEVEIEIERLDKNFL